MDENEQESKGIEEIYGNQGKGGTAWLMLPGACGRK